MRLKQYVLLALAANTNKGNRSAVKTDIGGKVDDNIDKFSNGVLGLGAAGLLNGFAALLRAGAALAGRAGRPI
jgi:hypothetical protein